jgi:hypothetical protein
MGDAMGECRRDRVTLPGAIHGSGVLGRFKDWARRRGIEKDWYQFRDEALRQMAIDWLDANEIKYGE